LTPVNAAIDKARTSELYRFFRMSTGTKLILVQAQGREAIYQYLASVDELKKTGQLTRWIDDHDILLYEYEGETKAISNICRHFGGPVGYHQSKDGVFTCLWHNWKYSCKDGSCLSHPGLPLRQYQLKIVDDKVYVDLLG
jgi:methionine sulfoxide reductase heme-binding subunit